MAQDDRIIDMARALARALQMDERYKTLEAAREANDSDETLQKAIGRFELAKLNLNAELAREDGDKDKIMRFNAEMQDAYGDISLCEGMQRYAEAKGEADALLNWISAIIATAMNGGDPDAVDRPSASCTGSCESCGGCG